MVCTSRWNSTNLHELHEYIIETIIRDEKILILTHFQGQGDFVKCNWSLLTDFEFSPNLHECIIRMRKDDSVVLTLILFSWLKYLSELSTDFELSSDMHGYIICTSLVDDRDTTVELQWLIQAWDHEKSSSPR